MKVTRIDNGIAIVKAKIGEYIILPHSKYFAAGFVFSKEKHLHSFLENKEVVLMGKTYKLKFHSLADENSEYIYTEFYQNNKIHFTITIIGKYQVYYEIDCAYNVLNGYIEVLGKKYKGMKKMFLALHQKEVICLV